MAHNMNKLVYIVGGGGQYVNMWKKLGFDIADKLDETVSLVNFTGGEDVSPYLYGQKNHPTTYSNKHRDMHEMQIHAQCLINDIPMVGICRGAQFLNVMSGGEMYQDVGKHAVYEGHDITDVSTGNVIHVTSTHHQMMKPGRDSVLIAYATLKGFREWYDDNEMLNADISDKDIEVVAYPKLKTLCFQPHPEFPGKQNEAMLKYFGSLVEELLQPPQHG